MADSNFDVIVIGAGPGGYPAAIRAAQLGLKTACVEENHWGGICLNWGCIPTKSLLKNAEVWTMITKHAGDFGITVKDAKFDFAKVISRSRGVAETMNKGIQFLLKKYKVTSFNGRGKIDAPGKVSVTSGGKVTDTLSAKSIIIATGARARTFPSMEVDDKRVITYKKAMVLPELPKSMAIIGAGAIGVEFAYFYNAFGTKVDIIEAQDRLLPIEDDEVSKELEKSFKKQGLGIHTGAKVKSAKGNTKGATVVFEEGGKEVKLDVDYIIVAVGITGNIEDLGLEKVGVKTEKGAIIVDGYAKTNVPGIYAIGDVAGPPWLAHKATHEAITCVEKIAGKNVPPFDKSNIPGCTYCQPQVASVGLTEKAAKEKKLKYKIGKFPFKASGKAQAIGESDGFVKLIISEEHGEILGAHIIGSEATEMIAELMFARDLEADAESIIKAIHAHPTLSEAVMEAAAVAEGECIHL
ncbi:MAG: dihydrolipoyl dehydrogenase [Planctomycetes bacterium]|nr:dihydrolipoyl dehydrogenase [Planctomycetota bacterium]NUQ33518.1 dihydrolipoyl dehydrogenase [Planctomycetaceae bacterium]